MFSIITLFALAQLTWWVTFQVQEGHRIRGIQEHLWQQQIEIAKRELISDRADFDKWLSGTFSEIVLTPSGTLEVSSAAREDLDSVAGQRMRMFIAEGVFFGLLVLAAVLYMYRMLQDELASEHRQMVFLAATSHELKTPITSLQLYLDTMVERELSQVKREELLQTMRHDLQRLSDLIERLLLAQAIISPAKSFQLSHVDLSEETERIAKEYIRRLPSEQYQLNADIDYGLIALADGDRWQMIVKNLLDNAVKYSPGGVIDLYLTKVDNVIRLTVSDQGIGFDKDQSERIFDRFYRVGDESTRKTKGTGLGLYLVREIIESFGGKALAHSDGPGRGATFTVEISAAEGVDGA